MKVLTRQISLQKKKKKKQLRKGFSTYMKISFVWAKKICQLREISIKIVIKDMKEKSI